MPLDRQLEQISNRGNSQQKKDDSASRAGDLKEAQRDNGGEGSSEPGDDWQANKMATLRQGGIKELKDKVVEEALSPAKQSLSELLKSAWMNLISTWGLSLIWIDIHIFLSQVLGKDLFCSLGEEWFPKGTPRNLNGAKKSVGMTEGMAVGCLNLGCLFIIIAAFAIIALIVEAILHPLENLGLIFGVIFSIL